MYDKLTKREIIINWALVATLIVLLILGSKVGM